MCISYARGRGHANIGQGLSAIVEKIRLPRGGSLIVPGIGSARHILANPGWREKIAVL
jgi:hypothetical protein